MVKFILVKMVTAIRNSETTDRAYTIRVTANDTTDWQGNAITKTFNQTKIVKIGLSDMHSGNGLQLCGHLVMTVLYGYGYNNNGQSGLGNPQANQFNRYNWW